MLPIGSATIVGVRPSRIIDRRTPLTSVRLAATAVAVLVLAMGSFSHPPPTVMAGASPQAGAIHQVAHTSNSPGPFDPCRERFNKLQAEILGLGAQVLGALNATKRADLMDSIVNQRITVKSAEFKYENAKLSREVAEIGIVEFTEGIFKQDEATLEGELILAQSDLPRAEDWIEVLKERLAKTRQASKGSAQDLAHEYALADRLGQFVLRAPRKRLELEKAQSKLDFFRQFAKSKRVKEIQAEIESARANELAAQAQWEREKFKLKQLQEATKGQVREVHEERVLTLLSRAIAVAEQLKTKLDQADKVRAPGDQPGKEIAEMMSQLHVLVEQAQAENAAAKWAKVKPNVHGAAVRYLGAQAPVP
jgi:hypothetical protein